MGEPPPLGWLPLWRECILHAIRSLRTIVPRARHLAEVRVPMLFLQGPRDALADPRFLVPLIDALGGGAILKMFESADHSLHVPVRSGRTDEQVLDEVLIAAMESAITDSGDGRHLNSWNWEKFHPVEIQHPILGRIPLLKHWIGPGIREQSGSGFAVKAVTRDHGPSERMTVDLSNFDQSTLNLVTGQAGNFLSPFYMDQWNPWYQGYSFTLPFSHAAIERTRAHQLVLAPKN